MDKKIILDSELCIGCGSCEAIAPEHFVLEDDGKSHIKKQYSDEDKEIIAEAINSCPVKAISLGLGKTDQKKTKEKTTAEK